MPLSDAAKIFLEVGSKEAWAKVHTDDRILLLERFKRGKVKSWSDGAYWLMSDLLDSAHRERGCRT